MLCTLPRDNTYGVDMPSLGGVRLSKIWCSATLLHLACKKRKVTGASTRGWLHSAGQPVTEALRLPCFLECLRCECRVVRERCWFSAALLLAHNKQAIRTTPRGHSAFIGLTQPRAYSAALSKQILPATCFFCKDQDNSSSKLVGGGALYCCSIDRMQSSSSMVASSSKLSSSCKLQATSNRILVLLGSPYLLDNTTSPGSLLAERAWEVVTFSAPPSPQLQVSSVLQDEHGT